MQKIAAEAFDMMGQGGPLEEGNLRQKVESFVF
jgi:hypothetical protein